MKALKRLIKKKKLSQNEKLLNNILIFEGQKPVKPQVKLAPRPNTNRYR